MSRVDAIYPTDRITLREVGLRDGLQLARAIPSTSAKIAWMERETQAGVRHYEIGSFLPAARFPQFADIEAMLDASERLDIHSAGLTLNERGAETALRTGLHEMVCVISATDEHSQANMRRSRKSAVELVGKIVTMRDNDAPDKIINAGIAMAFGCSIAGEVRHDEVIRLAETCLAAGADIVGIADTVGYAGPKQVGALCARIEKLCAGRPFIIHLHDTRGMGIANAAAALDNGARVIDASLGGLGGCPFAPGATGNVVFEDIVYLAETMGYRTGIDLAGLKAARAIAEEAMPGERFHGTLTRAGPPPNVSWKTSRTI